LERLPEDLTSNSFPSREENNRAEGAART
jgi:hypothetical protein